MKPTYWIIASLVVIVGVAIGLTNRAMRSYEPKSLCLSQVKGLGVAMLAYQEDNDGQWPLPDSWLDAAESYGKTGYCAPARKSHPDAVGIALNYKTVLIAPKQIEEPESFPMIFECPILERNAVSSFHVFKLPWHPDRMAVAYADGHAKYLP